MKKGKLQFGLISSLLTLVPLFAMVMTAAVPDDVYSSRVFDWVMGLSILVFLTSPVIGLTMGVMSLIKKSEPFILPLIGIIVNSIWIVVVVVFIITTIVPIILTDGQMF